MWQSFPNRWPQNPCDCVDRVTIPDAPRDGTLYGRLNGEWWPALSATNGETNTLTVDGLLATNTLSVASDAAVGGNLDVSGTAAFGGDLTIAGGLTVTGPTNLDGAVQVNAGMNISGTLDVGGPLIANDMIAALGPASGGQQPRIMVIGSPGVSFGFWEGPGPSMLFGFGDGAGNLLPGSASNFAFTSSGEFVITGNLTVTGTINGTTVPAAAALTARIDEIAELRARIEQLESRPWPQQP